MSVKINIEKCTGCKACFNQCPNDVFSIDSGKGKPYIAYGDECSHCGVCALECKFGAISHTIPLACYDDLVSFSPAINKPNEFNWKKYV